MPRIANWTKLKAADLWRSWSAQFDNETEAIATAIFIANRLVKDKAPSTKRRFYSLKDEFIKRNQHSLTMGQAVRDEVRECWDCDGTGDDWCWDGPCEKCGGTGIYSKRTLYLHKFIIGGQAYSFHSYQEPISLSEEKGEDLESYGGKFSESELADLALPMSGLLRMLAYIAVTRWHMKFVKDRYYPRMVTKEVTVEDRWQTKLNRWRDGLPTPVGGFPR